MSTRGYIVWQNQGEGQPMLRVYHHWDSYPSGIGQTLIDWLAGKPDDRKRFVMTKITDEKIGWSTLNDKDIDLEPGWNETPPGIYSDAAKMKAWEESEDARRPQSYTARGESLEGHDNIYLGSVSDLLDDHGWTEYLYVINQNITEMVVWDTYSKTELGRVPLAEAVSDIGTFVKEDDEDDEESE